MVLSVSTLIFLPIPEICQQLLTKNEIDASSQQRDYISFDQVMKITGVAVQGLPPSINFTLKCSTGDDYSDVKDVLETPMVGGTTARKKVCIGVAKLKQLY